MRDDLNDPRISAYKPQRRLLLPTPPGLRQRRRTKAQREQRRRADVRATRLHLVGLSDAGVIIMGAALVVVILMTAMALAIHR
jgi:hypothetical protein